jgi:hypothetical protein
LRVFNYKIRSLFSGPHLLGSLLILAGFIAFASPAILESESSLEKIIGVGAGAVILGLLIISSYSGTLIDLTGKRYKDYQSIGGYKLGEWNTLPDILKVRVISDSYLSTNTPNGISPTLSGKVTRFRISLYSSGSEPVHSFLYSNRKKAIKEANLLASNLNADLILGIQDK